MIEVKSEESLEKELKLENYADYRRELMETLKLCGEIGQLEGRDSYYFKELYWIKEQLDFYSSIEEVEKILSLEYSILKSRVELYPTNYRSKGVDEARSRLYLYNYIFPASLQKNEDSYIYWTEGDYYTNKNKGRELLYKQFLKKSNSSELWYFIKNYCLKNIAVYAGILLIPTAVMIMKEINIWKGVVWLSVAIVTLISAILWSIDWYTTKEVYTGLRKIREQDKREFSRIRNIRKFTVVGKYIISWYKIDGTNDDMYHITVMDTRFDDYREFVLNTKSNDEEIQELFGEIEKSLYEENYEMSKDFRVKCIKLFQNG